MSWLGLVLLVLGAWLAYKLAGALLKLAMFALALVGAYWFAAPQLGWPTVSDLFYVLGPDFGGKRIEEVADPRVLAKKATEHVVDGVIEQVKSSAGSFAPGQEPQPAVGQEIHAEPSGPPADEASVQDRDEAPLR